MLASVCAEHVEDSLSRPESHDECTFGASNFCVCCGPERCSPGSLREKRSYKSSVPQKQLGSLISEVLQLGARLGGRMATQGSKKGSEKVLGRVLGKGSQKGSEKGACYGFYSKKGF